MKFSRQLNLIKDSVVREWFKSLSPNYFRLGRKVKSSVTHVYQMTVKALLAALGDLLYVVTVDVWRPLEPFTEVTVVALSVGLKASCL